MDEYDCEQYSYWLHDMNHKVKTQSVTPPRILNIHAPVRALKTLSHGKLLNLGYNPNSQYRHLDLLHFYCTLKKFNKKASAWPMRSTPKFVVTCSPASCYATASYVFKSHTTLENFNVLVRFHIFATAVSQMNTAYHFQQLTKSHLACVTLNVCETPFYLSYNWNILNICIQAGTEQTCRVAFLFAVTY